MKGWTVQVLPIDDIKDHKVNFPEDCDCIVRVDDMTGAIVHNAFDKRQKYENSSY